MRRTPLVTMADFAEPVVAEEAPEAEFADLSALQANIKRKGNVRDSCLSHPGRRAHAGARAWPSARPPAQNAYYYAHAHKVDAPAWDGSSEPRLLEKSKTVEAEVLSEAVTNYSWADEKEKVRVYVQVPGVGDCADEAIVLDWTETSIDLRVHLEKRTLRLSLETLHDKISDAKVRKKPDKLVLTLAKETAYSWHDLKK